MPTVMLDAYIPKVCETLESRQEFLGKLQPDSRIMKPYPGMREFVELRVAADSGNRKWFYAIDLRARDIVYLMHLNPLRMKFDAKMPDVPDGLKRFAMYQGSVWRAKGSVLKIGGKLPSNIFWKLFKGNQNWFSDSLQSEDGKRFWENRIDEALERGYPVYAVHFNETSEIEVDKIEPLVFDNYSLECYWPYEAVKDTGGMYWRFAIVHP